MSIKSLYPDIRPSLNLDFANTKVLDSRITFARASTATYYDGKTVSKAEENLALQSQGFNTGVWQHLGFTSVTGSQTAPDGTSTAFAFTETTASDTHRSFQSINFNANQVYTISFFAKYANRRYVQLNADSVRTGCRVIFDIQNGAVTDSSSTISTSVVNYGNGWYRCIATLTCNTPTGNRTFPIGGNNSSTGNAEVYTGNGLLAYYLWGVQVEERSVVTAYTPTTSQPIIRYQPTLLTASTNTPRFDHNPTTNESLGLLIEEQRTNLVTYSENFGNSFWTKTDCFLTQNGVAPDGTSNATLVTRNSTAYNYVFIIRYSQSVTTGQTYTFSVFLKPNTYSGSVQLSIDSSGTGGYPITGAVTTNLSNGTYVSGSFSSYTINQCGNGWYRVSVTGTATTDGSIEYSINTNNISIGQSFYIWGAQLEIGSFPTSYIPTVASQATRSADSASMTGTNFTSWYNNTQGALYIESQNDYNNSTFSNHAGTGVEIHSNAFQSNLFAFNSKRDSPFYKSPWFNIFTPGGSALVVGNGALGGGSNRISGSAFYKSSFSWNFGNTFATSADGTTTESASLALTSPPTVTTLGFAANNYAYNGFNGRIKKLIYYPKSLTNTQLQALTQP